jgi:hypothetical protein
MMLSRIRPVQLIVEKPNTKNGGSNDGGERKIA